MSSDVSRALTPRSTTRRLEPDAASNDGWVDRLLIRWLALVRSHTVFVHVVIAVAIAGLSSALLLVVADTHPSIPVSLLIEAVIVVISLSVPVLLTLLTLRRQLMTVMGVVAGGPPAATSILLRFVSEELRELETRVSDVQTLGTQLHHSDASHWVRRRCFDVTTGRHVAVDASVPSVFLSLYGDYLEAQDAYLKRTQRSDAVRINISDDEALAADARQNSIDYRRYVKWHKDHGVELLHLPPTRARHLARLSHLGDRTEIGTWFGEVSLVWENVGDGILVRLAFVGEPLYARCVEYLDAVLADAFTFPEIELAPG